MELKTCKKCGFQKPLDRFATFKLRSGEERKRGVCWDCRNSRYADKQDKMRAYRKEYNANKRTQKQERDLQRRAEGRAYVDKVKSVPCVDCGVRWPPVCMDLDHVRGDKFKGVANLVGGAYRLELIEEEVKKCEVVCACCHRLRTQKRKQNLSPKLS